MNVWVEALARFAVVMPDDAAASDKRADDLSEAIEDGVNTLVPLGVQYGSASVIDWTEKEDA